MRAYVTQRCISRLQVAGFVACMMAGGMLVDLTVILMGADMLTTWTIVSLACASTAVAVLTIALAIATSTLRRMMH